MSASRVPTGRFDGQVVLVTGAARGQGRSHAVAFAEEGADVIVMDICADVGSSEIGLATEQDLAETVALVEKYGRRAVSRKVDVRDLGALTAATNGAVAELGRLDIVCANAGILVTRAATAHTAQQWKDTVDINLNGVWNTCRAAVPHVQAGARGGSVVITSSVCGLMGVPGLAAYTSAKHGVVGLMKTLAIELGPDRIRVNTVNPGNVDTAMIQNDVVYALYFGEGVGVTKNVAAQPDSPFAKPNVLPTPWIQPEDVSAAVLFLASEEGRYITGVSLPVDAGYINGRWN